MTTSADVKQEFFVVNQLRGEMGKYSPACDQLHPEMKQKSSHYALTETQYFGINVPEAGIDGICYMVYRPNLKVVQGGVMLFQGIKRDMIAAELFDTRSYMSDDAIQQGLNAYQLDSGYSFKAIGPSKFHLSYNDPVRNNFIDVVASAASDPIVWPNGLHLEQTMKNEGEIVLRGQRFKVNGYHVRDRSWEGARLERPERIPPITWMFGAADENLSFNCTTIDHPELSPQWKGLFEVKAEDTLKGGWIWKDGQAALVKSARNCVRRNPITLFPESIEVDIVDTKDRALRLKGTVTAAAPYVPFMHQRGILCLTRWETSEGKVFWGEVQDAQYTDYVSAMMKE